MLCRFGTDVLALAESCFVVLDSIRRIAVVSLVLTSSIAANLALGQQPATDAAEDLAAEMKRFPAVEPADALETLNIQQGYSLQLVASEPLVSDPVDACFDERARMYVAEMHGYPYSAEVRQYQPTPLGKPEAGVIRLLEDTDGDGLYDRSVVFADRISWPTSVCCHDGGLFVLAPSRLLYLKDTDGDDVADVREEVLAGFSRGNVQGLANNMMWSLDNRIIFSGGTNGGDLSQGDKALGSLRGSDVALDPRSRTVEFLTGGRQFGMSRDDWGNRFVCTNSNHIQHIVYERADLESNPSFRVPNAIRSIAVEGAAAPVFRKSPPEPWRIVRTRRRAADPAYRKRLPPTELVPIGFFTSATGITPYRGDAMADLRGQVIIGDVGGNLVHRKMLTPDGASFIAKRVDKEVEFITSTDTWFRPVNFVNAPDGSLYILDMYRETIEHPRSIPEDIKAHVDLQSGHDRGRIWRLVGPDGKRQRPQRLDQLASVELVRQLESDNAWVRETAQRLIVDRQDQALADRLRALARSSSAPLGRLHAVTTLMGLQLATVDDFRRLIVDEDPRNRAVGLRLWRNSSARAHTALSASLRDALERVTTDSDARVRIELALSLRVLDEASRLDLWQRLAESGNTEGDLRTALLLAATSAREQLVANLADAEGITAAQQSLMLELVELIGADRDPQEAIALLSRLPARQHTMHLQQDLLTRLGRGLRQRSSSLTKLLSSNEVTDGVREAVNEVVFASVQTAGTENISDVERQRAIAMLGHASLETAGPALSALLIPQTSQQIQASAIASLSQLPGTESGAILLENWPALSPQIRQSAIDALLSHTGRTELLLSAIGEGRVRFGDLEPADRELLLNHPREAIRQQAMHVFGQPTSTDRAAVIAKYRPALSDEPDLTQGRAVFQKVCATCHRLGEEGHVVGPELTSVSNKSAEDLLIALLDPNREAQPRYASYTILTTDGRVVTGLIAAESSETITLRRAEAKEDTIRRENIEVMNANGVSLMPAGLEKDLTPRQVADVIGLVRSLTAPSSGGGR